MRLIRTALPVLAGEVVALSDELRLLAKILAGTSGIDELPTSVLASAYEVIAIAPHRDQRRSKLVSAPDFDERCHAMLDAAMFLTRAGYRAEAEDVHAAIRVWGVAVARAAQMYGAAVVTAQSDDRGAPIAGKNARLLGDLIGRFGMDLRALTEAASAPTGKCRQVTLEAVHKIVTAGNLKRVVRRRGEGQLSLMPQVDE